MQRECDREAIVRFYGELAASSAGAREEGERASWRRFNNFLKHAAMVEMTATLRYAWETDGVYNVLDVGCGTGGDLRKWHRLGAKRYLGFDASAESIRVHRTRTLPDASMTAESFVGDFTLPESWSRVPASAFGVASCQFTAHYAFADRASAHAFMSGLSRALDPSEGRALLVVVDAETWRHSLRRTWGPAVITQAASDGEDTTSASPSPAAPPLYGDRYMFQLETRVTAPEWWVHRAALAEQAAAVGLEIGIDVNLATFAAWLGVGTTRATRTRQMQWAEFHEPALRAICGGESGVTAEAWAVASLYRLFVLRRPGSTCCNGPASDIVRWLASMREGTLDAFTEA